MNYPSKSVDVSKFENAVAQIRIGFVGTLGQHLTDLTELHAKILRCDFPAESLLTARDIAHKIHGVAKTLGFAELGGIAAKVENTIETVLETSSPRTSMDSALRSISDLIACIADIRAEAGFA